MGFFDFLKHKNEPERSTFPPDFPQKQEICFPDEPKPEPVNVPHITLTYGEAVAQGWHFKRKSGKRARITRYTGTEKNVIIPAEIDGHTVNELRWNSFQDTEILSVMLPNTLRKIASSCFRGSKLKRAVFEDGITRIPDNMFRDCEMLESVRLPEGILYIGDYAFDYCLRLKYISIPNRHGIVHIGEDAFYASGLEGFAMCPVPDAWLQMNGKAFRNTPLHQKYKLFLTPEKTRANDFRVLLTGRNAKIRFPEGSYVILAEGSVAAGCELDLSGCASIYVKDKAIPYESYPCGVTRMYTPCGLVLPQGKKGLWFPEPTRVTYPDGSRYDGYLRVETPDADTAVLTLYTQLLHSYSVKYKARKVILRAVEKWTKFEAYAIHTGGIEHLVLEHFHGGEGELFSCYCHDIHCVEWDGKIVYIPPASLVGIHVHDALLKAFCGRNLGGILHIFDGSVAERLFTDEKKATRLTQKQHIIVAADVLRSTETLFSDRTPYLRYLQTHKRYAQCLCRELPEEYAGFLRDFYGTAHDGEI